MLIITIRTVILYIIIIFALRLMGKKQLGELQPSELVTTIMVSNIATLSLEDGEIPMLMGIIPILMIVSLDVITSGLMLKSGALRKLVSGTAKVIISGGVIDQRMLRQLRYTIDDLTEAMREQGIFDLSQVQYAIVETNGKINFLQKQDDKTTDPPETVVKDGKLVKESLSRSGLDEKEIIAAARNAGQEISSVFFMSSASGQPSFIVPKNVSLKEKTRNKGKDKCP